MLFGRQIPQDPAIGTKLQRERLLAISVTSLEERSIVGRWSRDHHGNIAPVSSGQNGEFREKWAENFIRIISIRRYFTIAIAGGVSAGDSSHSLCARLSH
jgi:hypothetical protein